MPSSNTSKSEDSKQKPYDKPIMWAILVAIVGVAILAIVGRFFVNEHSEKIRFVTINALSLFVLLAIVVQTYIYRRQWGIMERQEKFMKTQTEAMISQGSAMIESVKETRKMVAQNERAVAAAEETARIAERSFYVSERPHFGIANISMQFEAGMAFSLSITFLNGGKSPAWQFSARPGVSLNNHSPEFPEPGDEGPWSVLHPLGDLHNSFFPAGRRTEINYVETEFKVTRERYDAVMNGDLRLFVRGKAEWKSTVEYQSWDFCLVYFPSTKRFGDYGSC